MRTGEKGLALIKGFESLRLRAYFDSGGVPTIGWGHTKTVSKADVRRGKTITRAKAESLFRDDLRKFETCVDRHISVKLLQEQFDALVSWSFNVGCGALQRSTLRRLLNRGQYGTVPGQLARWNKDNGKVLRGLVRRRAAEGVLWLSADDGMDDEDEMIVLARGAKGKYVRELQSALNGAGAKPKLKVDGDFGKRTERAVKAYQRSQGLLVDGIAGPQTRGSLGLT